MTRHPAVPYVVPFVVFLALLAGAKYLPVAERWEYPLRVFVLAAVLWLFSRRVIDLRMPAWLSSIGVGVAVFAIWVAPDALWPGYRQHWLFQNGLTGSLKISLADPLKSDPLVLAFRSIRAVILVPIIEELFWRAWLMRWLINPDFERIRLGAYAAQAFWVTALLFASEHGPYWEVGLICGVIYNWWMIRTKSLGDCILAHAVTNACLSVYVMTTGKWEFWM